MEEPQLTTLECLYCTRSVNVPEGWQHETCPCSEAFRSAFCCLQEESAITHNTQKTDRFRAMLAEEGLPCNALYTWEEEPLHNKAPLGSRAVEAEQRAIARMYAFLK